MAKTFGGLVEMAVDVKGDKELRRRLEHVRGPGAAKALYAGVRAGMTPVARALRAAVNAAPASQAMKAAARKTVAQRFSKSRYGQFAAKIGFGVGKQTKSQKAKAQARAGAGRGVGISKSNIHWFVLGTSQRETDAGRATGKIQPVLSGLTSQALSSGGNSSLAAARQKISQVIAKEAAKRR